MQGTKLLARGWYHDARGWWRATITTMAVVVSLVLLVVGSFTGMEEESQARIEDVFTGDVRITKGPPAAASDHVFSPSEATLVQSVVHETGGTAHGYYESRYVLSRRGLVDAYVEETEGYQIETPGAESDPRETYRVGIVMGFDPDDEWSRDRLRGYLTAGVLPREGQDDIQMLMSERTYRGFLDPGEKANLTAWPPTAAEIKAIQFEVTAARIDPTSQFKDVIRKNAVVVGLYQTDIDAIDRFLLVGAIQDVRGLDGHDEPVVNAFHVQTSNPGAVRAAAGDQGWGAEGSEAFSERYMGQLMAVIQGLTFAVTILFFVLPAFLLWYGLSQQMDRNQRELAVCRAIGVPQRTLLVGMARLGFRVVGASMLWAGVLTGAAGLWLANQLPAWRGSPVPLGFSLPLWAVFLTLVIMWGSLGMALVMTQRNQRRSNLATSLRSP